jgi:UDP-N-acetylmuramoyl-tripeptide--D-alanyl-D-alanine ligase
MTLLTHQEIVADLGDLLLRPPATPIPSPTGLSIDTRTLEKGDLFLVIQEDTSDSHVHVEEAFQKGATAALISQTDAAFSGPCFVLRDLPEGIRALARGSRRRALSTAVVGVTGSVGKTGTKEALAHVLSGFGATHSSKGNYNNHWGVPISLVLMPRATHWAVFEMGMNHPGEIRPLSQMARPHVTLITRIGAAHQGFFNSLQEIADAKAEIFEGLETGGIAVLNHDDPFFDHLKAKAQAQGAKVLSFGTAPTADIRLDHSLLMPTSSAFTFWAQGQRYQGTLAHPGAHWMSNALGVLGVCAALNLPLQACVDRLATLPALPGRGQQVSMAWKEGHFTFLDDSYNANPTSMEAAIHLLAQQTTYQRRIAVLGDMLELGAEEGAAHTHLAQALERPEIDAVFTCGPRMKALHGALPPTKRGAWGASPEELYPALEASIQPQDIVLLKGSNSMKLSRIMHLFSQKRDAGLL